jgi:hypothetical protein
MDSTYKDFVKDGEIIYPGKVDSVKAYPGNNRINLSMLLISDPKISKVKMFWNNGTNEESVEKTIQRTSGVDTVWFSINNLAEGTYTFTIYTYDNDGNRSVKTEKIGTVYGDRYISQLVNRAVKSATYVTSIKGAVVKWFGVGSEVVGEEIIYTDSLNVVKKQIEKYASPADSVTTLPAYKKGSSFQYRTLYKPTPVAIDTFYSNVETKQVL